MSWPTITLLHPHALSKKYFDPDRILSKIISMESVQTLYQKVKYRLKLGTHMPVISDFVNS